MRRPDFRDLDGNIASTRIILSLAAMLSLYIDPSAGGLFHLDIYLLTCLVSHLIYSVVIYAAVKRGYTPSLLPKISTALDLTFAAAVTLLTEGSTSPSYVFFVFAIVAVGFRNGFRETMAVTLASMMLYLLEISLARGTTHLYVMRVVYLAIAGYLIGFFSKQRAAFEARLREYEMRSERQSIARSLHDGYVQALAGVNLRLETCSELLKRKQIADALGSLKELQIGVAREFDEVRAYVRSLAEIDRTLGAASPATDDTRFNIRIDFTAPGVIVEQVLQIALEGMRNAWRHGNARDVTIKVQENGENIRIMIDDDGVGFRSVNQRPWAIASRVAEFGGNLKIASDNAVGAHLEIEMPAS
jgi:signal transduction histidine kinase